MKKLILTFCLCAIPFLGFAEWKTIEEINRIVSEKGISEIDREFWKVKTFSENNLEIMAIEKEIGDTAILRWSNSPGSTINGKVDYQISSTYSHFDNNSSLYLQVLDDQGYLIKEINIHCAGDFTGKTRGSFDLGWNTFKNIKYYHITGRG